jgi:hypothetical protein
VKINIFFDVWIIRECEGEETDREREGEREKERERERERAHIPNLLIIIQGRSNPEALHF